MNTRRKIWSTLLPGLVLAGTWAMPAGAADIPSSFDGEGPRLEFVGMLDSYEVLPGDMARRTFAELGVAEGTDLGRTACTMTDLKMTGRRTFDVGFSCDGLDPQEPVPLIVRVFQTPLQDLNPEGGVSYTVPILLQCTKRVIPKAENLVECGGETRTARH